MSQLKFYQTATLILLLLNLGMIAFFFATKPPTPARQHPPADIHRLLRLDAEQEKAFGQLVETHQQAMRTLNRLQQEKLSAYFSTLLESGPNQQPPADGLREIQELEAKKITITYEHFRAIKNLLRPEQQPFFKEFMQQALQRILGNAQKNPPPPKDF